QVVDTPDRFAGNIEHDIAFGEAGPLRRSARYQIRDHFSARRFQFEPAGKPRIEGYALRGDAESAAPHLSITHDARRDIRGGVDADREADTLRGPDHRRVDADDPAVAVHQRSARVAWIERRIGLDHAVDQPPRRAAQAATERADDAGRHRRLKPE